MGMEEEHLFALPCEHVPASRPLLADRIACRNRERLDAVEVGRGSAS